MTIPIISTANNPITGVFGTGRVQLFARSGVWIRPPGISAVRVRAWGAGGSSISNTGGGTGGSFALKTIYDLGNVTSVTVSVGISMKKYMAPSYTLIGPSSSFGEYVIAPGGGAAGQNIAAPVGVGDILHPGGDAGNSGGGGGAGNLFGPGGSASYYSSSGTAAEALLASSGSSGGGGVGVSGSTGGNGLFGTGGRGFAEASTTAASVSYPPVSTMPFFSIDFLGCGPGGGYGQAGLNGGGGGPATIANTQWGPVTGGFPGGGGGAYAAGADGLVIVEY